MKLRARVNLSCNKTDLKAGDLLNQEAISDIGQMLDELLALEFLEKIESLAGEAPGLSKDALPGVKKHKGASKKG